MTAIAAQPTNMESPPAPRGTLLVVDDEPLLLRAFSRVLMRAGHEVAQASDGGEAAALVTKTRFDCAFVDLGLPGAGGLEVLASLRALDPALPVILMTGAPTLDTAIRAVDAGALRYLVKPIDSPDLQQAAVEAIRMRRREAATGTISASATTSPTPSRSSARSSHCTWYTSRLSTGGGARSSPTKRWCARVSCRWHTQARSSTPRSASGAYPSSAGASVAPPPEWPPIPWRGCS
jgi:CheY-like chemotaxis protein